MIKQTYQAVIARPHMAGRNRVIKELLLELICTMEREGSLAKMIEAGDRHVVHMELDERPSTINPEWTESKLRMELTKVAEEVFRLPSQEEISMFNPPTKPTRWERFKQFIKGE